MELVEALVSKQRMKSNEGRYLTLTLGLYTQAHTHNLTLTCACTWTCTNTHVNRHRHTETTHLSAICDLSLIPISFCCLKKWNTSPLLDPKGLGHNNLLSHLWKWIAGIIFGWATGVALCWWLMVVMVAFLLNPFTSQQWHRFRVLCCKNEAAPWRCSSGALCGHERGVVGINHAQWPCVTERVGTFTLRFLTELELKAVDWAVSEVSSRSLGRDVSAVGWDDGTESLSVPRMAVLTSVTRIQQLDGSFSVWN